MRILYLKVRSRIVPWCMRPGCWERTESFAGKHSNMCPVHIWQSIQELCGEDPTPEG